MSHKIDYYVQNEMWEKLSEHCARLPVGQGDPDSVEKRSVSGKIKKGVMV